MLLASHFASEVLIDVIAPVYFLGDIREGGPPDPIPNSEVKPFIADGTAHKSVGE